VREGKVQASQVGNTIQFEAVATLVISINIHHAPREQQEKQQQQLEQNLFWKTCRKSIKIINKSFANKIRGTKKEKHTPPTHFFYRS